MSSLASRTARFETPASRARRYAPRIVAIVVLGWSAVEVVGLLAAGHTVGAEVYGILVAVLALAAGLATVVLVMSSRPPLLAVGGVIVLWALIALGGLAGTVAHAVGPDPNHGPVDSRARPAGAPLVFTALGVLGAGALVYDTRRRRRRPS
jgi:hypothetical protein